METNATTGSTYAVDWRPFALLLIDVQRDFLPNGRAAQFPHFPGRVGELLAFCRTEGIDVVHLRAVFRANASDWMVRPKLAGRIPCVESTRGAETLPFALEQPGEPVIVKQSYDGFQNPALDRYLQSKGKRFVLTAGLITSVCVLLTTASAAQRGYLAAVVEDCCADKPEAHDYTLQRYTPWLFERVAVSALRDRHPSWHTALERLDTLERTSALA